MHTTYYGSGISGNSVQCTYIETVTQVLGLSVD